MGTSQGGQDSVKTEIFGLTAVLSAVILIEFRTVLTPDARAAWIAIKGLSWTEYFRQMMASAFPR